MIGSVIPILKVYQLGETYIIIPKNNFTASLLPHEK